MKKALRVFAVAVLGTLVGLQGCAIDERDGNEATTEEALVAPTGLRVTFTSSTSMAIAWDAAAGATKYLIFRGFTPGTEASFSSVPGTSTAFGTGRLTPGTQYCWVVRYLDAAKQLSDPTPSVCATTLPLPAAPANVVATATSSSRITVTWGAVAGATKYVVEMAPAGAGPPVFLASVAGTVTSAVAANLNPGTTYVFDIRVITATGTSVASTPPAVATTFVVGLEAYWKFDEDMGTTAMDATLFQRTAALTGGAAFSNDKPNVLDDKSTVAVPAAGGKISVANSSAFNFGNSPFSVLLWVKTPQPGASVHIIGLRNAGCGSIGWELAQDATGLLFADRTAVHRFGSASLPAGTWTHVAVTFDGLNLLRYVNGAVVAADRVSLDTGAAAGQPLTIGHVGDCTGGDILVDEAQIYSAALTPAQVAGFGTLPAAPTGLALTVESSAGEVVTWPAIAGAVKYFVYLGTVSGGETFATSFLPTPNPTFADGHLDPGTSYFWKVAVVKGTLFSNPSSEVFGTTFAAPTAPTNITATIVGSDRIRLDWSAVPRATAYFVFQSINGQPFAFKATSSGGATSASIAGLSPGVQYRYEIATHDTGNLTSPFSAPVTAPAL